MSKIFRYSRFYFKNLFDPELTYYASSLSFYTLFSMIPLLLVILTTITNLPSFDEYYEDIKNFIFSNIVPVHSDTITKYIDTFLQKSINLGLFSFIMIIVASLLFFENFEYIISKIYRVQKRGKWDSITTYWTFLTLTPIALGLSFFLSSKIRELLALNEVNSWFNIMALGPYIIIWLLFFSIFKIAINKKIHTKSALYSSFVTALTWNMAKYGFISYVFYNQTYTTLYGSFSILIFFFLWIYISWIIFMYGLKLCYLIERTYYYKTR